MKTKYKYIQFNVLGKTRKTSIYDCRNIKTRQTLGTVKWNTGWRQYCFYPELDTIFSCDCLVDIAHFINTVTDVQ